MERLVKSMHLTAMFALGVVVVISILCLSFDNAYGYSATVGINKPNKSSSHTIGNPGTGTGSGNDFTGHTWDKDNYTVPDDGSNSTLPPTTTPEPGTIILLGAGLVGLAKYARRRS